MEKEELEQKMDVFIDIVRSRYDLPFLKRGVKVKDYKGRVGEFTECAPGGINIKLKNGTIERMHPTWEITYLNQEGIVIKDFKENSAK